MGAAGGDAANEILIQEFARLGFQDECTPEVIGNLRKLGIDTVADLQDLEQADLEEAGIRKIKAKQLRAKILS